MSWPVEQAIGHDEFPANVTNTNSIVLNSIASALNSITKVTKLIAKATNSTASAKVMHSIANRTR